MSSIYIVLDDLRNKFNHEFIYDFYEHTTYYSICGLFCCKCKYKIYIYLALNGYMFEKQLNFSNVININGLEYAYDSQIITCNEQIVKNIIE